VERDDLSFNSQIIARQGARVKVPFGKYCGIELSKIPDNYLHWLSTIELRDRLRSAVAKEIRKRHLAEESRATAIVPILVPKIISTGFRILANKFHPDHGGDGRKMVELNRAVDWLRAQVGGLS